MRKTALLALAVSLLAIGCGKDSGGGSTPENTSALCQDGVDNDGDGAVDCKDAQCFDFAFCQNATNNGTNGTNNGTGGTNAGTNNGTNGGTNNGTTGTNSGTNTGTNNMTTMGTNNGTTSGTNNMTNTGAINIQAQITPTSGPVGTTITVTVTKHDNFTLDEAAIGMANVPGHGHYAVYLDMIDADHQLLVSGTSPAMFDLTLMNVTITPGIHQIVFDFVQNDGTDYQMPIQFNIQFEVTQ